MLLYQRKRDHRDVDKGSHQADEEAIQTGDEVALMEIFFEIS